MASYDALESSLELSRPAELYEIVLGSTTYRYTSAEDTITLSTVIYTPEAIERGPIADRPGDRTGFLEVRVPASNAFASQYVNIVPGNRATLRIIRIQRDETPSITQVVIFSGKVRSVRFIDGGLRASIGAQSIESALLRQIPTRSYSQMCNHVLYGPGCLVDSSLFEHTGTVTAVGSSSGGPTITVGGASGFADGYFNAGYVKPSGLDDRRLVVAHVGDVLTLNVPFGTSVQGLSVDVFAGCNHLGDLVTGHCKTKFNNRPRFGGWPYVPTRDIWQRGIV